MTEKYIEQFLRVERWFKRLMDGTISRPIHDRKHEEHYLDDLYSFFINCYHLKDWIEKDSSIECTKKEVEAFIATNDYLKICADLCNSSKHLTLWRKGRSEKNPEIDEPIYYHNISIDRVDSRADSAIFTQLRGFSVKTNDNKHLYAYSSLELAAECLNAWTTFLLPYISNRVLNCIKSFDNQSVNSSLFSSTRPLILPKPNVETVRQKASEFGDIVLAESHDQKIITIVRLKGSYAHGEDREKTRGGILHFRFDDLSFANLIQLVKSFPPDSFVWLVLAMEDEERIGEIAKYLDNALISNIRQLSKLEDILYPKHAN